MALTITIPGAVETTTGSTAPAVLTVGVGAPGVGVPSGGTTGQVLQKLSGVSYDTGWLTLPADFITSVTSPLAVAAGVLSVDLSAYSTTAQAAALYYPLSGNPSAFLTASALTPYAPLAGATFTGKVNMAAPTAGSASLNLGVGTAPTTSVAGDIWIANNINYKASDGTLKAVANTNTTNTFTQPQIIGNSGASAALRITQLGTGEAFRVEDSVSPDATPFVIDANGKVGIGVAPDTTAALKVDNNGIMFGDGTTQTTAATAGIPDAPSDGSTYGRNNGAWAVAGGGGANIQTFTTAGAATWTKPSGKTMAWIRIWSGGSGGGSGARQATTVARGGGSGAGMGGFVEAWVPVSFLGATETVTVGAGGAGGASVAVDSTNGNPGSLGGNSVFSIYTATSYFTSLGSGGTSITVNTLSSAFTIINQSFTVSTTNFASAGAGNASAGGNGSALDIRFYVAGSQGGGGGGAAAASVTTANGGNGGLKTAFTNNNVSGITASVAGGTAGNPTTSTAATTGTSGIARYQGGTGGGGGGYKIATAGQAGASGAQPGGGGGGGGASDNLFASGAGGAGGAGMVVVVCY